MAKTKPTALKLIRSSLCSGVIFLLLFLILIFSTFFFCKTQTSQPIWHQAWLKICRRVPLWSPSSRLPAIWGISKEACDDREMVWPDPGLGSDPARFISIRISNECSPSHAHRTSSLVQPHVHPPSSHPLNL